MCLICKLPEIPIHVSAAGSNWELAHVVSRARGGRKDLENLFPAHTTCNFDQGIRCLGELRELPDGECLPVPVLSIDKAREALARMLR